MSKETKVVTRVLRLREVGFSDVCPDELTIRALRRLIKARTCTSPELTASALQGGSCEERKLKPQQKGKRKAPAAHHVRATRGGAGTGTRPKPNARHGPHHIPKVCEETGTGGDRTYMTMRTVLTTTLCTPPPRTGSAMTGRVSLTIMFARRSVTRRRCPFFRIGLILFAYSFCFLRRNSGRERNVSRGNARAWCVAATCQWWHRGQAGKETHGVPLTLSTLSCVSSRLM